MLQNALADEYVKLVKNYYPEAEELLSRCYVRVRDCYIIRLNKSCYYLAIYYPQNFFLEVKEQQKAFKDIAENMGFIEVVYININRIIRDPLSSIKKDNPRFWLELYWLATQNFYY